MKTSAAFVTIAMATALACAAEAQTVKAPANPDAKTLVTGLKASDFRAIVADNEGTVSKVTFEDDAIQLSTDFDGLKVWIEGLDCTGAGEQRTCRSYKFTVSIEVDTEAKARELERRWSYVLVGDFSDGNLIDLFRFGFVEGGVTLKHVSENLSSMIGVGWHALEDAFKDDQAAAK